MIEFLIPAAIGAIAAYAKNQTFEGKLERLQRDCQEGKLSPQQAEGRYQQIIEAEIDKIPSNGIPVPPEIKEAFKNGLDYRQLAGKVDPDTYNALHAYYWFGED